MVTIIYLCSSEVNVAVLAYIYKNFTFIFSQIGRSWITYLFAIETTENNPKVLIAWFTGNFVPVIEQVSEKVLINGIYYVLKKFLGQSYQISRPDRIYRYERGNKCQGAKNYQN